MDIMRILSIEANGITDAINGYTSDPLISNVTKNLKKSIECENVEEILYLMKKIQEWYKKNQMKIQKNEFVFNKEEHIEIQNNIDKYIIELENFIENNSETHIDNKEGMIKKIILLGTKFNKDYWASDGIAKYSKEKYMNKYKEIYDIANEAIEKEGFIYGIGYYVMDIKYENFYVIKITKANLISEGKGISFTYKSIKSLENKSELLYGFNGIGDNCIISHSTTEDFKSWLKENRIETNLEWKSKKGEKSRGVVNMQKKLQVFISSTYTDLIEDRQAAVEAILDAGHIPAGMELFKSGKKQMTTIEKWIDESNVYMLILGGRYGSIEPESQKSYTHLEYEYALSKKMPMFAVVIDDYTLKNRTKKALENGKNIEDVCEISNKAKYDEFKKLVLSNISGFFKNETEIKLEVHRQINDIKNGNNLLGWVREEAYISQIRELQQENERLNNIIDKLKS